MKLVAVLHTHKYQLQYSDEGLCWCWGESSSSKLLTSLTHPNNLCHEIWMKETVHYLQALPVLSTYAVNLRKRWANYKTYLVRPNFKRLKEFRELLNREFRQMLSSGFNNLQNKLIELCLFAGTTKQHLQHLHKHSCKPLKLSPPPWGKVWFAYQHQVQWWPVAVTIISAIAQSACQYHPGRLYGELRWSRYCPRTLSPAEESFPMACNCIMKRCMSKI